MLFEPTKQPFLNCTGEEVHMEFLGSLIGVVTPINTKTKTFTLLFKQSKGVQSPLKFAGEEATHQLELLANGGPGESVAIQVTYTLTAAEEVTIKA